jgi:hypothetical protein
VDLVRATLVRAVEHRVVQVAGGLSVTGRLGRLSHDASDMTGMALLSDFPWLLDLRLRMAEDEENKGDPRWRSDAIVDRCIDAGYVWSERYE